MFLWFWRTGGVNYLTLIMMAPFRIISTQKESPWDRLINIFLSFQEFEEFPKVWFAKVLSMLFPILIVRLLSILWEVTELPVIRDICPIGHQDHPGLGCSPDFCAGVQSEWDRKSD
jgi:hypothetical protein